MSGPQSASAATAVDDIVVPFQTVQSGMTGRLVRLGSSVDTILAQHQYPDAVSVILGQAVSLVALLGTALKFEGRFILQTKTDGPLGMMVAQYQTTGGLRGYASFDRSSTDLGLVADQHAREAAMLGTGYLAMTIDPDGPMERYQGIVALAHEPLASAALTYFQQSEQLPTFIRLAVARQFQPGLDKDGGGWRWRAGGLVVQHLAAEGGRAAPEHHDLDDDLLAGEQDEDWTRVRLLAATVEDHELIDPTLSPQNLLYRLFHEEGVRVGEVHSVAARCGCTRDRVAAMLTRFGRDELADMREADGAVSVTCEFCSTVYRFTDGELV